MVAKKGRYIGDEKEKKFNKCYQGLDPLPCFWLRYPSHFILYSLHGKRCIDGTLFFKEIKYDALLFKDKDIQCMLLQAMKSC